MAKGKGGRERLRSITLAIPALLGKRVKIWLGTNSCVGVVKGYDNGYLQLEIEVAGHPDDAPTVRLMEVCAEGITRLEPIVETKNETADE